MVMASSDLIHFKILPSIGHTPPFYTLITYHPDSQSGTAGRYATLSAAIAAAAAVSLPADETFGGIPGQSPVPGSGPIVSPPNPVQTTNSK